MTSARPITLASIPKYLAFSILGNARAQPPSVVGGRWRRLPRLSYVQAVGSFPRLRPQVLFARLSAVSRDTLFPWHALFLNSRPAIVSQGQICARSVLSGIRPVCTDPHPSPPRIIPDWRRFGRGHPRPSQIGVDFSESGLDWRRVHGLPIPHDVVRSRRFRRSVTPPPGCQLGFQRTYMATPQVIPTWPRPRAVFAWMRRDWRRLQRSGLDWRRVWVEVAP
jgi:hypothetical protein